MRYSVNSMLNHWIFIVAFASDLYSVSALLLATIFYVYSSKRLSFGPKIHNMILQIFCHQDLLPNQHPKNHEMKIA